VLEVRISIPEDAKTRLQVWVEGRRKRWIEVLQSRLKNGDVMAELHLRTLPMAQHQRLPGLQNALIRYRD
jgi:hypothetical protein